MLLKKLIKNLPNNQKKIRILGLASNSKKIKKGFIFFAIKGQKINGEKFINEAIEKGAIAIVSSKNCNFTDKKIPVIKKSRIRNFLSEVSSQFYKLKPKNIIAVTGTNGKTSVADLFYQILNLNKVPVASIGTLGVKYKKKKIKSKLTTPDTISIHKILKDIKINNIENVIIEASSHGLKQNRLDHINLKAGIFTNFTQDHLDYHKTMQSYLNSKLILFKSILEEKKSIITDKSNKEFSILKKISKQKNLRMIDINKIKNNINKNTDLKFNEFQLKNLAMAIAAAKLCNLKDKQINSVLKKIQDVDGRLELVKIFPNNIKVFIDYAHTPDALLKALEALKNSYSKNISLVFGCGGDRDFKKRPLMAKIAKSNCKKIYVTDDNPRNERPEKIRNEIIKKIRNNNCFNIGSRIKAIETAIINAEPNEIILIAGKGHETQQIYKNKTFSISDKQIIRGIKVKIKILKKDNQKFTQNKKILEKIKKGIKVENFDGIAIDSREVKKNNLFLTIKGKNNDGSKFIDKALKKGAKYIVSSNIKKKYKNKTIRVKSEINFLNSFASHKRSNSSAKILAITGSIGKTSLKNLIKELLQNFGETYASPRSYNNHFGVPISLSNLNMHHKFGVFEVGMSKAGEINNLSKLIKPHIGIITNISEAHIKNFRNIKGIAEAKGEIINNIERDGTLILNRDDKFFDYFRKKAEFKKIKIVSFGKNKNADVHPIKISRNKKNIKLIIKVQNQNLNLEVKNINIYNVLSSLALLKELNVELNKISKCYKNHEPSEGRGKIHIIKRYNKNFKLIDESYNANPLSVKNAIMNLSSIKKKNFKKYLLLGDMLELGKKSDMYHKNLSEVINNSDIDKVFVKGVKTLTTYKYILKKKRGNVFQHNEDVDFTLNKIIAKNDYLMIKGSNATGLNNLSKRFIKGY